MTVCTNDVALCNLVEDVLPIAVGQALRNSEQLVSQVVELENHRIALAAISAGMLAEEGNQVLGPFFNHRLLALTS
jgi:hypothetical protein